MPRSLLLVAVLLVAVTARAQAQSATNDSDCAADSTTYDMRACLNRQYLRADSALNRYYGEALRLAGAPPKLRAAEAEWIRYRNINCSAQAAEYEGGTMLPLVQLGCMLEMTTSRTHELWSAYLRESNTQLLEPRT